MKRKRTHMTTKNNHNGKRFPKNHKVYTLKEVDETLVKMGRPSFKFDPDNIISDRTLECWGLPKDDIMKIVLRDNLNIFMVGMREKESQDNQTFSDVEKLYLFSEYLDHCVKEGTIMEKYKILSDLDCLLEKIVSEMDKTTIEKVISETEMETITLP